jgi:hypothetical protein
MKKNLQQLGLQISGNHPGGLNRVNQAQPSLQSNQYGKRKSPYISQIAEREQAAKSGAANTDSELYQQNQRSNSRHHRPGPTRIGMGSRHVSVSLAQRNQEKLEKEKMVLEEVEQSKRDVLHRIN